MPFSQPVDPSRPPRLAGHLCRRLLTALLAASVVWSGCVTQEGEDVDLAGQDVRLTILHTADWHGRLIPYDMDVLLTDEQLGLDPELGPYGGVARLAYLVNRERANAGRSIYLDSGDCFQGAPIFNIFRGELSFRAMSLLRPDGVVIGNHEFDNGLDNLVEKAHNFVDFPLLAANYHYLTPPEPGERSLGDIARPFTIVNVDGLTIGIIGIANFSSLSSIGFADNSIDIVPMDMVQSVQQYINLLHPQVNLIFAVSHAGLDEDHEIIEQTIGLDAVLGGHLHIVLDPPRLVRDASGRDVLLAHSGAFLKYLGRLDVVARSRDDDPNDFEIESFRYEVIPIDSTVPEDPAMLRLVEPYAFEMRQRLDVSRVIAYAPKRLRRFGSDGGDSPLGNLMADAIRERRRVETDFGVSNSLGIRSDIIQGPVIIDQMYNIFPFPNTITTMTLSGNEVQEMLDFNAQRSAGRGCATQLQASGISFVMDCSVYPARARDIRVRGELIRPNHFYTMATNDYIAGGGSGFRVLRFNNTQQDTGISIRDAVIDAMQSQPSCLDRCDARGESPDECAILLNCSQDMADYNARFCEGMDRFSERERCLDDRAPRCLEESPLSDFDICRMYANPKCEEYYLTADREACYEAAESQCTQEDFVSPREACAAEASAADCLALQGVSEWQACMDEATINAEDTCLGLPCVDATSDGRIQRILPSNEFVPTEEDEFASEDAAALMEWIQTSPLNHEDCF